MSGLAVTERSGLVRFDVRVQPRASRNELVGVHGGALKVRLAAPPVEGAANEALITLLATSLGVTRGSVRIIAGAASRTKVVEVAGVGRSAVERLAAAVRP